MSGFSADWLALRAPADARARDAGLARALAAWAKARAEARGPIRVVDLGAGTGATLAALADILPGVRWRLVDHDPALLRLAAARGAELGAQVETLAADLSRDLAAAFDPAPDLATASAFFDLASADWIDAFAEAAAQAGAAVHAALSYDGREAWTPPHPDDAAVHAAFLADMRRDKGLGPALGAGAAAHLAQALRARGYSVAEARSDWDLTAPRDAALIAALAEGKADAVRASEGWRAARTAATRARIGHVDLLATPG
ncbi:class I SAM-dependent methyltransferase [Rubrimonas sp.]|uniref:class I SAM-dependent methyltransferase n=1 Tax=Rubrimonas sp. TaxID=2036015 RepID=UPI002FDDB9BF